MFFALVGFAVWFVWNSSARSPAEADGAAEVLSGELAPEAAAPVSEPDEDATGRPATERAQDNRPPTVFAAAATGNVLGLQELLDGTPHATRVHQLDASGWTALHHAAYNDHAPCVRLLLERGADPNAEAEHDCAPLHMAAAQGSAEVIALLVEAGAVLDLPDDTGQTPLHYATMPGRLEAVRALLEAGAHPSLKDVQQETPLDLAVRLEDDAVASALREKEARPGSEVRMADELAKLGDSPAARRVPATLDLEADDPRLVAAAERARATLPSLLEQLAVDREAAVKFPLRHDNVVEHVWGRLVEQGPPLRVELTALPMVVPAPEGPVDVEPATIVDWQLRLDDQRRAGGFGQRAIYEALREEYGFLPESLNDELSRFVEI